MPDTKRRALVTCILSLLAAAAGAQESSPELPPELTGGLNVLDWGVIAVYAAAMLGIGAYYARKIETSEDFYLGGRQMRPSMVGLSLFAAMISTISYLAEPGEVMSHGPIAYLMYLASLPIIYLIVGFLLIPHIMKLPITSAYELLEKRLGMPSRLLGSGIFLLIRFVWMGLVVYTASRAVVTAMGLPLGALAPTIMIMGTITVVYSSMGGLQAVVLTDAIQSLLLIVAAIVCVIIITVKMGGVGWFPTQWSETWDTQPVFSLDPTVRVTMIGSLIATTVWWVCTAGSDQMAIQRYLATRDVKSARKAFLINNIADVCVNVTLISLGFALLGFFREHYPELLRATLADEKKGDYLFPLFVVNFMKFGTAGLVIAGMLAAAMSSLSSGLNSAATVLNTDFLPLLLRKPLDEKTKVRHGMAVSAVIGVIIILLALVIENVRGNLFEVTQKTSNLLVSPLFSLFFLALFVKRANTFCAMFAAAYGFVVAIVIAFWDLTGATPISFQWIGITSLLASVGAGVALSFLPWDRMTRNSRVLVGIAAAIPLVMLAGLFIAGIASRSAAAGG
ncbi:MAG TPA: sodium/solute symporter [Candidatus Hydrogenedentes bacterium]|nr:sodium/solute symporter [Candidatus Hydrogenedentota bacterium]